MSRLLFAIAALSALALVSPAIAAQNEGGGSGGPTVGDLSKRGHVCTTFDHVYLACKDPSGNGPPFVCAPNGQCIPGNPQQTTGGSRHSWRPPAALPLARQP
jgi:hypothetical protein